MSDASSLHCPNCGAAVDPDARRCPYCKARLATISCPSCFALIFDTAAFCPKCGTRRARVSGDATSASCPGCRSEMHRIGLQQAVLLECAKCDGVWVEADVFERLCSDRAAQAAVLHRFPEAQPVVTERVRYRPCVQCGKMMNRVNFGRISGAVVDVCRGHGTFLDAGELHQIVQFIHAGGLDRARERQIQDLKEQERRLQALELQAAQDRGAADPRRVLGIDTRAQSRSALMDLIDMIRGTKSAE
jgi:Zn-finger nucleic acid-binding protein